MSEALQLFAATAPAEVPGWFKHTPPPKTHGECPVPKAPVPPRDNEQGDDERLDDFLDRRSAAVAVYNAEWAALEDARAEWNAAQTAWERSERMAKLVQWRWAYAAAMVAAEPESKAAAAAELLEAAEMAMRIFPDAMRGSVLEAAIAKFKK